MSYFPKVSLRNANFTVDAVVNGYGDLRVAEPILLTGSFFSGSSLDANIWTSAVANAGTVTLGGGEVRLRTNTTANATAKLESVKVPRVIAGTANYCVMTLRLGDAGVSNNQRFWGCYDTNNGYYFVLDGAVLKVGSRKTTTDTFVTSFNGGNVPVLDTNYHLYEIYYTGEGAWLLQDGKLIHKYAISTTTFVENPNVKIRSENNNSGGSTTDASMFLTEAATMCIGLGITKPYITHITTNTTTLIKSGPGTLHSILIGTKGTTETITIYDNTAASGTVFTVIDCATVPGPYISLNWDFSTGLTVVTAGGGAGDYTILSD